MIARIRFSVSIAFCALLSAHVWAMDASVPGGVALELAPTFESIGASVSLSGPVEGIDLALDYRAVGESRWQPALNPVACPAEHVFRGSILLLRPDTSYEVRARLQRSGRVLVELERSVRTWAESVPIGRDIVLPAGVSASPLIIREQGKPGAWIRYRAAPGGSTVDVGRGATHAVVLDHAAYVVVEGLVVRGGTSDAVCIMDAHDVRVRGCDISGWGDPGRWGYYADQKHQQWAYLDAAGRMIDHQEGIRIQGGGSTRVVVEENLIHHPRGTANCWAFQHPHGPEGVVLSETGGNNVVRNNDIIVGDGHRWNDAIASEYNGHVTGGPYRDTDIHGNLLVGANDDGIELDGGQINVRCWDNRIDGGLCGVSCAPNLRGPSYVFRNVIVSDGDERGACGAGFKMGGDPGTTFLLNNTVYFGGFGLTGGHYGKNPSTIFSRNNVFSGPAAGLGKVRYDAAVSGDLDHDLIPPAGLVGTEAPRAGREGEALYATPVFADPEAGDFRLGEKSAGRDAGVPVPGLIAGQSDLGAVASGAWQAWPPRAGAPNIRPSRPVLWIRQGTNGVLRLRVTAIPAGVTCCPSGGEGWVSCAFEHSQAGEGTILACRVDATELPPGPHRTFVSVRTDAGRLRSVPLLLNVVPAVPVIRAFEAEACSPGADFERVDDASAQGGAYERVISSGHAGALECSFDLPAPGHYYVLARVRASGPLAAVTAQDSVTLQIDVGTTMTWKLFGLTAGAWRWVYAAPRAQVDGAFLLTAGRHHLTLGARARGAEIDAIVVANAPFSPAELASSRR